MIHIAVCDDTIEYLERTVTLLEQWGEQENVCVAVDCFDNGDDLLSSLAHQSYDLIFLDIIMPMFSGIDTCSEIRKENKQVKIIFLSVSPEFGVDAFRVKANGYLLKPLDKDALFDVLNEYLSDQEESNGFLLARSMSMVRRVPLDNILYLEAQNKHIVIHTSDGNTLTTTTPLHQLSEQLAIPCFFQCHRSYIVNMNFVHSFTKNELTMTNDSIIPISRNVAKEFRDTYFTFLFGKAGEQ